MFDVLLEVQGLGEFLAQQVLTDLLYPGDHGDPLYGSFTTNEWVQAGPGAKKGIYYLLREDVRPGNLLMVMRWLANNQEAEFERLGLDFPYLAQGGTTAEDFDGDEATPKLLSVSNIQTCLCEFSKYMRVVEGGKSTRQFRPSESELTKHDVMLPEDDLESLRVLTHITTAEPGDVAPEAPEPAPETNGKVPQAALAGGLGALGAISLDQPRVVVLNPTGELALPYAVLMIPLNSAAAAAQTGVPGV